MISKLIEIRDQGIDWGFFVLRFRICICGVYSETRVVFTFFDFNTFWDKIMNSLLEIDFKSIFRSFDFKV